MNHYDAWIGTCHIEETNDVGISYTCFAAVYATYQDDVESSLQQHFKSQHQHLLKVENVFPIMTWLNKHGHNNTVMNLANLVNTDHIVELSTFVKVDEITKPFAFLTTNESGIPLLPDQSQTPLQYQKWIAPELHETLFGQPNDGLKLRTYFIVDPTLRKKVVGKFDLDDSAVDIPKRCLFKGKAAEELKEAAPYLLDMTLLKDTSSNHDTLPSFHKDFFENHWGQNTGIFIRSTAGFEEVWHHFRKFTKLQMEEDNRWIFFRFWDPRTLPTFLDALEENDAHKFLASHQIVNLANDRLKTYQMTFPLNNEQSRTLPSLIMKNIYVTAFSQDRKKTFIDKLHHFISEKSDNFASLNEDKKIPLLDKLIKESSNFNIGAEEAVANFVLASVQFGRPLVDEQKLAHILASEHHELDKTKALLREIKNLAS